MRLRRWLVPLLLLVPLMIGTTVFTLGPAPPLIEVTPVWAQAPAPAPPSMPTPGTWGQILGFALNAVGTMVIVKGLAWVIPWFRERVPDLLPIVAGAVGPLLAWVQLQLTEMTGVPISLGVPEILAMFTGGSAVAIAQVVIQRKRRLVMTGAIAGGTLARDGAPI